MRNSQGLQHKCRRLQVMGNKKHRLVGAPRFELGTSCAQGRRNISWKSFLFNLGFENKRVRKIFDSGTMCGNVAPHAWSPPNFPHSEITAKVLRSFTPLTKTIWQHGVSQFVLV